MDVSCHTECSKKKFTPIFFFTQNFSSKSCGWSKARYNATKHSSFWSMSSWSALCEEIPQDKICWTVFYSRPDLCVQHLYSRNWPQGRTRTSAMFRKKLHLTQCDSVQLAFNAFTTNFYCLYMHLYSSFLMNNETKQRSVIHKLRFLVFFARPARVWLVPQSYVGKINRHMDICSTELNVRWRVNSGPGSPSRRTHSHSKRTPTFLQWLLQKEGW